MDKTFTSQERSLVHTIKGVTIIDHAIRMKLSLTVEDYCFLSFLMDWTNNKNTEPAKYTDYYRWIGFDEPMVRSHVIKLRDKKMILQDPMTKILKPSSLFLKCFDNDSKFDEIWAIHPKGNKAKAKINYTKSVKIAGHSLLCERLNKYVLSKDDPKFLLDLQGWLNPTYRSWEDLLPEEMIKKNNSPKDIFDKI